MQWRAIALTSGSVHIQFVIFYLFSQEKYTLILNKLKYICALHPCAFWVKRSREKKSNVLALSVNIWTMNYLLISHKVRRSVCVTYSKWTLEIAPWPKRPIKTILSSPFILLQSLRKLSLSAMLSKLPAQFLFFQMKPEYAYKPGSNHFGKMKN